MRKYLFLFLLFIGFSGCDFPTDFPTELPILESAKPADNFSRAFIKKIMTGQIDSAFLYIDPELLNDEAKTFITNVSRSINGAIPKKYRVVEMNETFSTRSWTNSSGTTSDKFTRYRLGYEYEFEKVNVLFTTTISEKNGKFLVVKFNGGILPAPLAELTKFSLADKSVLHYIFLVFCILVPLFILTTLVVVLFSKMTVKKKIIWFLIALLIALPKFVINWGNGELDFRVLNISLNLGSGFYKPTLYSAWLLSFNIPIGAIIFWFKRRNLLSKVIQKDEEIIDNDLSRNEE